MIEDSKGNSVQTSTEEMSKLSEGFSANFLYQVKVTFERPDTTDVFDTKQQATEFAREQLRRDDVVKVAIKKVEPKEDKAPEDRSDADDGL